MRICKIQNRAIGICVLSTFLSFSLALAAPNAKQANIVPPRSYESNSSGVETDANSATNTKGPKSAFECITAIFRELSDPRTDSGYRTADYYAKLVKNCTIADCGKNPSWNCFCDVWWNSCHAMPWKKLKEQCLLEYNASSCSYQLSCTDEVPPLCSNVVATASPAPGLATPEP